MTSKVLKKLLNFLRSMKFGIALLFVIMAVSLIGTVIPQESGEKGLKGIYDSFVFGALFVMLVINLSLCSIFRIKRIIAKISTQPTYKAIGSWFLHLGILIVIVCYAYGNITFFSEGVYGVPGTVQSIEGTEYKVKIHDFNIEYSDEGAVQQYTSNIELIDESGKSLLNSHVAVNEPMRFKGYSFYQTGYGWTVSCDVSKTGSILAKGIIYEQTTLNTPGENIAIYFNKFYPDFAAFSGGFSSLTDQLNNPVVLYTILYRGNVVKMDIASTNEIIKWNEYEFIFNNPLRYTYLEVNKMNGQLGAFIGALLIVFGLIVTFYFKPSWMIINIQEGKLYVFKGATMSKEYKANLGKEKDNYVE